MPRKSETNQALTKLTSQIETLDARLDSIDKTLVRQEANLGEHMRRTDNAEKSIHSLISKIEPLEHHKALMEGLFKGVGILAVLTAIVNGLIQIFS